MSLFDSNGRLIATQAASYPVEIPQPGWAEQDPAAWWQSVCRLGPEVVPAGLSAGLTGICVSGQTPLCAPFDAQGNPLRKAILWLDRRATAQVNWLDESLGEAHCRQVSANRLDSYFGGVKWLWYRQAEPELFQRTWKILQASSYITWKLTGQVVVDPSQAGLCSPCFNHAAGQWDEAICQAMGIPLELLPEIRPAQAVIGSITLAAALATGLPEGTPVVCGGGDFALACLGAGVTGRGRAALMLGTAGNLLLPGVFNTDARLLHTWHVTGQPLTFGGVMAGGNLSWFGGLYGAVDGDFFALMDEEAALVPAGSEGLVFLPYLMGERTPVWDAEARGAFVGLSSRHTRAHLYRAILEGVAFGFRQILEIVGADLGLEAIVAIDGGARSVLWRSILAATLDRPVCQGGQRSGTALGAAFLAAYGVGAVDSFDAIEDWMELSAAILPDPAARRRYDTLFPVYAGLYPKLKADFAVLNKAS